MTTGKTNAYDLAQTLKTAIETAFGTEGVPLPTTRYVTTGTPVATCDSLVVSWSGVYYGIAGNDDGARYVHTSGAVTRSIRFLVAIFRCIAVIDPASGGTIPVATMQTDAQKVLTDAYVLHKGLAALRSTGNLRDAFEGFAVGTVTPIEPSGGIGGVQCEVEAELS